MKLSDHITRFAEEERPVGSLLDADMLLAQGVAATRFYAGFTVMGDASGQITGDMEISDAEWAHIRQLFILYVERESAPMLEASRGFGVEAFGRSSSEVAADINQAEAEIPLKAFCQPIITV